MAAAIEDPRPGRRIALVNQPFDAVTPPRLNSLGLWTYEVARRLARQHEVHVFAGVRGLRGREEQRGGVRYRWLPTPSRGAGRDRVGPGGPRRPFFASPLFYRDFSWQLARRIAQGRFDVVHVLNFSQFMPFLRRASRRSTLGLHMECSWLDQLDARWLEPRLAATDVVIGCSRFVTEAARARFPGASCRFITVYNGVDPARFRPPDEAEGAREPGRLLYVGRGSPEKGTHVLLEAFGKLRSRGHRMSLELVGGLGAAPAGYVVGISDDPRLRALAPLFDGRYRDRLRAQIEAVGAESVRVEGPTDHESLAERYRRAEIFVFPSVWDEPFGIPLVEAMASGLPVVATRGGGIPEIVEDGVTGLLVEPGDGDGLVRALERLHRDPELRARMGRAGRERARQHFDWERIASELAAAYALRAPSEP